MGILKSHHCWVGKAMEAIEWKQARRSRASRPLQAGEGWRQPTNQASGSGLGDFSAPILSLHILPCRSRSPVPRLSICWAFGWDEAADGLAAYLSLAHWFISPAFHLGVLGREAIQPTSSSLLPSYQHTQ
ncbi:hypothetical protein PGT21_024317 [Puccinia graminis f. sp. tritici]|uniref:Uncharacterized protein n=1 Tax=Puccinia graminis f. sp. tritici TaxID=56615 RepID=A0A5B0NCX6_PUCGR|nr:hypothetical protein PGT21_024317 [Puccinia graminis f. sp. tritici]